MQRNIGNEIMIAVGAILIISFGLLFAILLSSSETDPEASEVAEVASATETDTAIDASATPDAMITDASPSEAPSETAEASATETTEETEASNVNITPNEAETEAENNGSTKATDEPEVLATATEEIEPTVTNTRRASSTPSEEARATNTRRPLATNTDEPSATNTERSSATATHTERPTRTERPSPTPSPTATLRPSATATSQNAITGIIPTPPPSPTLIPVDLPTRTPSSCQLPQGWTTYTVLAGNTLFAIALATNSTVDELRSANCIENIDNIQAGDVVFVPRAPLTPVATFVNTGSRAGLRPLGCQSPNVQITSPISVQRINGTFTVYGSANRANDFSYYKLEVRPDAASIYNFYSESRTQVTNGVLGEINSELFGTGLHWIKLTLVDARAAIPSDASCEIPVIFE